MSPAPCDFVYDRTVALGVAICDSSWRVVDEHAIKKQTSTARLNFRSSFKLLPPR